MLLFLLIGLHIPLIYRMTPSLWSNIQEATPVQDITMSDSHKPSRPPVYFMGIGGPNFMEDTRHPAYAQLAAIGREITTKVKPKAVVVFSAHWQGAPDKILINAARKTDLIYDFYGFPPHYYEYDFPNQGSPEIAEKVIEKLEGVGIEVERVERGLDHGVWAGFMVGRWRPSLRFSASRC